MSELGQSRLGGASCRSGHVRNAQLATFAPKQPTYRDGPEAVISFRLSLVSPNIDRRLTSAMRRCGHASHYDRKFDVANEILDRQVSPVAGIDRYAIAIRIDQLEIVVTKKLVLSNGIYRHSL